MKKGNHLLNCTWCSRNKGIHDIHRKSEDRNHIVLDILPLVLAETILEKYTIVFILYTPINEHLPFEIIQLFHSSQENHS